MKNYYEILEVSQKASIEVIEKAYKTLAKKYHPDGNVDKKVAEAKMKEINEAYAVLSSGFFREQYDKELQNIEADSNNPKINTKKESKTEDSDKEEKKEKFLADSSIEGITGIVKNIYANRPDLKKIKDLNKKDYISIGLTILIMIVLMVILWAIPFTRPFVTSIIDIF
jgi:curved DNA-binding protein CbpA